MFFSSSSVFFLAHLIYVVGSDSFSNFWFSMLFVSDLKGVFSSSSSGVWCALCVCVFVRVVLYAFTHIKCIVMAILWTINMAFTFFYGYFVAVVSVLFPCWLFPRSVWMALELNRCLIINGNFILFFSSFFVCALILWVIYELYWLVLLSRINLLLKMANFKFGTFGGFVGFLAYKNRNRWSRNTFQVEKQHQTEECLATPRWENRARSVPIYRKLTFLIRN